MTALVRELSRNFLDLHQVARHWDAAYRAAKRDRRHLTVYRLLAGVVDLMRVGEQLHGEYLSRASDEELADERRFTMVRLVRQYPQLVLDAAEVCGWQVIPPKETDSDG